VEGVDAEMSEVIESRSKPLKIFGEFIYVKLVYFRIHPPATLHHIAQPENASSN
jgi:hypothetical protein